MHHRRPRSTRWGRGGIAVGRESEVMKPAAGRLAVSVERGLYLLRGTERSATDAGRWNDAAKSSATFGQNRQNALDDRFDAEAGGVDVNGVVGRSQRRHRAIGVARVAGENFA